MQKLENESLQMRVPQFECEVARLIDANKSLQGHIEQMKSAENESRKE